MSTLVSSSTLGAIGRDAAHALLLEAKEAYEESRTIWCVIGRLARLCLERECKSER